MPEQQRRRPTVWIVLTCLLAVAAVGLGIWAVNAQSDADDAQAKLNAQEAAAKAATPAPTATEAAATAAPAPTVDPATQQQYEDAKNALGDVSDSADALKAQLDQAAAKLQESKQKAADASGALDKLKADAEAFKAQAELTKTCLRGSLDALDQAFNSGGLSAAAEQLKALAGQCRDATSS
jgi:chromosome segregation ATPase